jgi:hypothetical protein
MSNASVVTVVVIALALLTGCTVITKDIEHDFADAAEQWLENDPFPDVDNALSVLGPPSSITAVPGGYALLYQRFDILERQIGINSEQAFLSWFKFSLADADGETDTLVLHFNNDDLLVASRLSSQKEDYGEGGSVMFVLSLGSIVDTSDIQDSRWGPRNWGISLLQPPIVAQNRRSSLDAGESGLELRGTPTHVGQRTLEYR